jgi:hypothetical protein
VAPLDPKPCAGVTLATFGARCATAVDEVPSGASVLAVTAPLPVLQRWRWRQSRAIDSVLCYAVGVALPVWSHGQCIRSPACRCW